MYDVIGLPPLLGAAQPNVIAVEAELVRKTAAG